MLNALSLSSGRLIRLAFIFALVVFVFPYAGVRSAQAMNWCGENGMIRFSFVEEESNVNIIHEKMVGGVTKITLVAWLTDVEPVSINGTPFDTVGGFELKLKITGAEGFILKQEIVKRGLNLSTDMGTFMAGMAFGLPLIDGKGPLARWEIMFQGEVQDVMFSLDPDGLNSCAETEGCPESEPYAIYIGTDKGNQLVELFSAGYEPAWLNPGDNPDVTPVTGKSTWLDIGRYQKTEKK